MSKGDILGGDLKWWSGGGAWEGACMNAFKMCKKLLG